MDKTIPTLVKAIATIGAKVTVVIGGFGGSGAPIEPIHALINRMLKAATPRT